MFPQLPIERIRHSLSVDWVLSADDVAAQRQRYGMNNITGSARGRLLSLLGHSLFDPMIWFLLITGLLFWWLGEYRESIILFCAILPITGMDIFLHWRMQVSTASLSQRLMTHVTVLREHQKQVIPVEMLVPGDLVLLQAGEFFPADGILLAATHAKVDESSLTGEGAVVTKTAMDVLPCCDDAMPVVHDQYWGLVGTRLLTGSVIMRVVYTGSETLYGKIARSVQATHQQKTPVQRALAKLVMLLVMVASGFCLLLAAVRLYQGFGLADAILSAATLAIAALPDEFPMVFTFFLGVGVFRLAQNHALVRRAVSVETIGRVDVICTDKTGTLTQGQFQLGEVRCVEGVDAGTLLTYASLASRHESHDPLDLAILAANAGRQLSKAYQVSVVFPFTEERQRETILYQCQDSLMGVMKGAPEVVLAACSLSVADQRMWEQQVAALAYDGYKVIAVAHCVDCRGHQEPLGSFKLLGLLALIDPPRQEVPEAIQYCLANNLHVLMVTGDHLQTAVAMAKTVGIGRGLPRALLADEVMVKLEAEGAAFLQQLDVIARAVPTQKLAIVRVLQAAGRHVAVTGDGVNDVPALRAADVGIAMGERGSQSAREAASIVLLDDNFGSIVKAIKSGRRLFANLRQSFRYLIMVHLPYVLSATVIPLLGLPLLYHPIQLVAVELFIHPTCLLAFQSLSGESSAGGIAVGARVGFFTRRDWWQMLLAGGYAALIVLLAYFGSLILSDAPEVARANAFLAIGLSHIALVTGLTRLRTRVVCVLIGLSVLLLVLLLQVPVITRYFHMQPPTAVTWLLLSIASVVTGVLASLASE